MLFLPKLCYFCSQLNNTMNKNNLKHKYISVSIILLFAFICGLNYKQWHVTNNMTTKHLSLIYSTAKDEIGHGNIEECLQKEFKNQGIKKDDLLFLRDGTGASGLTKGSVLQ